MRWGWARVSSSPACGGAHQAELRHYPPPPWSPRCRGSKGKAGVPKLFASVQMASRGGPVGGPLGWGAPRPPPKADFERNPTGPGRPDRQGGLSASRAQEQTRTRGGGGAGTHVLHLEGLLLQRLHGQDVLEGDTAERRVPCGRARRERQGGRSPCRSPRGLPQASSPLGMPTIQTGPPTWDKSVRPETLTPPRSAMEGRPLPTPPKPPSWSPRLPCEEVLTPKAIWTPRGPRGGSGPLE